MLEPKPEPATVEGSGRLQDEKHPKDNVSKTTRGRTRRVRLPSGNSESPYFVGSFEETNFSLGLIGLFEAVGSRISKMEKAKATLAKHGEQLEKEELAWLEKAKLVYEEYNH